MTESKQEQKWPIVELFGPTIQGEGSMAGKQTFFLRTGGCDYRCRMCDSLHAVLPEQWKNNHRKMTAVEIVEEFQKLSRFTEWVTLSGGNPLFWEMGELVEELRKAGFKIAVETQGSQWKDWIRLCDVITISPKGPGMGDDHDWDQFETFLAKIKESGHPDTSVKIVLFDDKDIVFAEKAKTVYMPPSMPLYLSLGNPYPPNNPNAMERNSDLSERLLTRYRDLVPKVFAFPELAGAIFLPQLHVLVWGNDKGR